MRTRSRAGIHIAAVTVLAVLGACASSTARTSEDRPPHSLDALEAASEDVIDQVPHGRWTRIDADVLGMQRAWRRYRREAIAVDARQARPLGRALGDLATNASRREGLGTQQAANDVSAPVVELLDRYAIGHPVQVGRLDVLGRQVVLDVSRGRFGAAARSVRSASVEWGAIRGAVRRRAQRLATRVDGVLSHMRAGVVSRDVVRSRNDANDLLELVDALERQY